MSWHNEDDIKIIFDLTNEVTRLTAEVERLKEDIEQRNAWTAIKRVKELESKLSQYEGAVEVEGVVAGNVELFDSGIVQVISEKLKPLINQRVKVLILKEEVND